MADILGEVGQLVGNAVGGATTGGFGSAASGLVELINKFVPDKNQAAQIVAAHEHDANQYAQQQLAIQAAAHTEEMELLKAQIDVNKVQAGNSNLFVSGPRPFAQWATTIIILIGLESVFVATCMKVDVQPFYAYYLLVASAWFALLGINAGLHTWERTQGVAPDQSADGRPTPLPPRATLVKK
jgi:hypothetical protein